MAGWAFWYLGYINLNYIRPKTLQLTCEYFPTSHDPIKMTILPTTGILIVNSTTAHEYSWTTVTS